MKYIKAFEKYSLIGENITIVESMNHVQEKYIPENMITENAQNIDKDVIKVIPGKGKVYIKQYVCIQRDIKSKNKGRYYCC